MQGVSGGVAGAEPVGQPPARDDRDGARQAGEQAGEQSRFGERELELAHQQEGHEAVEPEPDHRGERRAREQLARALEADQPVEHRAERRDVVAAPGVVAAARRLGDSSPGEQRQQHAGDRWR